MFITSASSAVTSDSFKRKPFTRKADASKMRNKNANNEMDIFFVILTYHRLTHVLITMYKLPKYSMYIDFV